MTSQFSELYDKPRPHGKYYATSGTLTTTTNFDANNTLGRNGVDGYVINDGSSDFSVAYSSDGTNFGNNILVKAGEKLNLREFDIDTIKITHTSNSDYRILVI